jgi:hypothetical protein
MLHKFVNYFTPKATPTKVLVVIPAGTLEFIEKVTEKKNEVVDYLGPNNTKMGLIFGAGYIFSRLSMSTRLLCISLVGIVWCYPPAFELVKNKYEEFEKGE